MLKKDSKKDALGSMLVSLLWTKIELLNGFHEQCHWLVGHLRSHFSVDILQSMIKMKSVRGTSHHHSFSVKPQETHLLTNTRNCKNEKENHGECIIDESQKPSSHTLGYRVCGLYG